jgi:hypothetical protein
MEALEIQDLELETLKKINEIVLINNFVQRSLLLLKLSELNYLSEPIIFLLADAPLNS